MKLRTMKRRRILASSIAELSFVAGLGFFLAGVTSGRAQTNQTWNSTSLDSGWNLNSLNWDAGAAWMQNNNAIFATSGEKITLNGGPIIFNDMTFNVIGYTLAAGTGSLVLGNDLGSSITENNTTGMTTIAATIADSANGASSLTKLGVGTLQLSGLNTYTGKTLISAGTLSVGFLNNAGSAGNVGAGATIAIGAGTTAGTLVYTGTGETTDRIIDLAGTTGGATITQSGVSGNLKFTSDFTASGAGSKTLTLNGSTAATGEIAGAIVDNSAGKITSVAKNGSGLWTLSGNNTYSGTTSVTGGVLSITNGNALGSTSAGTVQSGSSELRISGGITIGAEPISISGGGISSGGALRNFSDNNTYSGTLTIASNNTRLDSDSGVLTMNAAVAVTGVNTTTFVSGAGDIDIAGAITTGTGGITKDAAIGLGAGTLTLGGANTYTGATEIGAGTLVLDYSVNNNSKLSDTAALILGHTTGGTSTGTVFTGGAIVLSGGSHTEIVSSTTLTAYTPASTISRSSGSSVLQLNTITPNMGTGLIFTGSGIATTDNPINNGLLGFWARMDINGVSTWATSAGTADSPIVAYTGYTDITRLGSTVPDGATNNVRITNGGTTGNIMLSGSATMYSLQMDASQGGAIIGSDSAFSVLNIGDDTGGAIWQTANAGSLTIGSAVNRAMLTSGGTDNALPAELRLINDSVANQLIVNSVIQDNGTDVVSVTVSGPGTVVMNGDNSFTGVLNVAAGSTVILTGNNAARPNNAITINGSTTSTFTNVNGGGTLQLQANDNNTIDGVSSALSNEKAGGQPLFLNNSSTLQLRSDSAVTFAGGNSMGGLGSATVTIDVNQLTSAGMNNTLTFAPGGFNVSTTTINVTGGNGYRLSLGTINNITNTATLTLNPTSAPLTIAGYTSNATAATTLLLGGTADGNVVTGVIANPATTGVTTVKKIGSGSWELDGADTFTGQLRVSQGTLTLAGNRTADIAGIISGDSVGLNATLNITNGTFNVTNTFDVASTLNTSSVNQTGGSMSITGGTLLLLGNNLVGSTGIYNLSGGTLSIKANGTRGVVLGTNTGTTGNFNLSDSGVLSMSGATLEVGRSEGASATAAITNSTGVFSQTGGTATVGTLTVGGGAGSMYAGNSGTLNLTGGTFTATNFTFFGAADNSSASILIGGTAQVTLPAIPVPTGLNAISTITFDGGTLSPAAASAAYLGGLTNAFVTSNGANLNVASGHDITISQALQNAAGQAGTLSKLGVGTLSLAGANTYTGATTVSAGTLAVAAGGSISGSSAIKVASGAALDVTAFNTTGGFNVGAAQTLNNDGAVNGKLNLSGVLSGAGTLNDAVTALSGSTLSPGDGVGNLTFANSPLTLQSGVQYLFDAGVTSDKISLTGTGSSLALSNWTLDLSAGGGFNPVGATFILFDGDTTAGTAELNGGSVGLPTIDYGTTGWSGGTISYNAAGNDIILTGVVPEPSSSATLLAAFGSLLGLQRFRRRI